MLHKIPDVVSDSLFNPSNEILPAPVSWAAVGPKITNSSSVIQDFFVQENFPAVDNNDGIKIIIIICQ